MFQIPNAVGTSQEQEMLIIIPIFKHFYWIFKVARSQISSPYVMKFPPHTWQEAEEWNSL